MWGQEMMSCWCGHRSISVALIFKCMCAPLQVLHTEAPAARFLSLSLWNHSLQTDPSSSSSISSRSSSFRPSHVISRRGSALTWATISLLLSVFQAGSHQVAQQRRATCSSLAEEIMEGWKDEGGGREAKRKSGGMEERGARAEEDGREE